MVAATFGSVYFFTFPHFDYFMKKLLFLFLTLLTPISAFAAQPLVNADWLKHNAQQVLIIDIRAEKAYKAAHIPNSVSAPYGAFGWREQVNGIIGQLPPTDAITKRIQSLGVKNGQHVVIVPSGDDTTAIGAGVRVYWTFKALGHEAVSLLDGGFQQWQGNTVAGDAPKITPSAFTATLNRSLITNKEAVIASGDTLTLVDARPDAQYYGYTKHPKAMSGGTIPDAQRLPEASLFNADMTFKTAANLRTEIAANDLGFENRAVFFLQHRALGCHLVVCRLGNCWQ